MVGIGSTFCFINNTAYNASITKQSHSYQMNNWPSGGSSVVPAFSLVNYYVEFDTALGKDEKDDGSVSYFLLSNGVSFQFQALSKKDGLSVNHSFNIVFDNFATQNNPQGSSLDVGWTHNGTSFFILSQYSNGEYAANSRSLSDWMHQSLPSFSQYRLKDLCIAGSHDAGMSVLNGGTIVSFDENMILTQSQSIGGQLMSGSRFFDIRPVIALSKGEFYTGHYSNSPVGHQGGNGQLIQDIIDEINAFTSTHSELIILDLSHSFNTNTDYASFSPDEWNRLFTQLQQINYLYKTPPGSITDLTTLTLADFIQNGPAVVIGVEDGVDLGAFTNQGFYTLGYSNQDGDNPSRWTGPQQFPVINDYANTLDLASMERDQFDKMNNCRGEDKYFLLSWTLTAALSDFPHMNIRENAQIALNALDNIYTNSTPSLYPNIIFTDNIVNTNTAALSIAINTRAKVSLADKEKRLAIESHSEKGKNPNPQKC